MKKEAAIRQRIQAAVVAVEEQNAQRIVDLEQQLLHWQHRAEQAEFRLLTMKLDAAK